MKKLLNASFFFLLSTISADKLQAQGGFGEFMPHPNFQNNGNLLLIGGGGAWIINSNFYLGGAGYGDPIHWLRIQAN